MAKTTEIVVIQDPPKEPRNLFSFFPKFKFELPFLKPNPPKAEASGEEEAKPNNVVVGGGGGDQGLGNGNEEGLKPNFVRFPKTQVVVVPPPLEAEAEVSSNKTSNPIILWQVYALGGIIISRWIWARWNERKARGRSPNDERPKGGHSDDGRSSDNE